MPGIRDNASRIANTPAAASAPTARQAPPNQFALRSSRRRRTVYDRERRELFALFSHGKVKRRRAQPSSGALVQSGSSFHIRAYQISHASKSKLNTHPDIKNTGIHLADKNPLGMF